MKKFLVMILVAFMAMSVLTGCGKSEEEKAMDEMASHMIDEAAADGVDLEEMLEEEYEAYEERHEQNLKEMEERKEAALAKEEAAKKPLAAFEAYMNATTSKEIIANAKEYNNAYDEYLKLANGDPVQEGNFLTYLGNKNINYKRTKIAESVYEVKAAYVDFAEKDKYEEARFYYNTEEDLAYIALTGIDTNTGAIDEILVLNRDGSTCKIDLSSITTNTTSYLMPLGFVGDKYIINTVDNADYKYWEFNVSENTAKGVSTSTSTVTTNEHWFLNTLEELNYGEPN